MYAPAFRAFVRGLVALDPAGASLRTYQDYHLRRTMTYAYENSPFYKRKFDEMRIKPNQVKRQEDLAELPFFTTADDILEDPAQFLAVPGEKVLYEWTTAGTTGKPKAICFTKDDISFILWTAKLSMMLFEVGKGDVAQICYALGQPTVMTGPFTQTALESVGCLALLAGNQKSIPEQIETLKTYGVTLLFGTPSYIHRLTEEGRRFVDLRSLKVRMISLGAEPWSESFRQYLQEAWGAEAYDSYGMTELGYLAAGECSAHSGLHLSMGLAVEVVDPNTGQALEPGQEGELVFTTLQRRGAPLIRYRSGDISSVLPDKSCACGLIPTARIARVKARVDDMTFLGTGENVYPQHFDDVLLPVEHVLDYQLIIDNDRYKDTLLLRVETDLPSEGLKTLILGSLYGGISFLRHDVMHSQTIAEPVVEFLEPGALSKERPIKARRFVDRRPKD